MAWMRVLNRSLTLQRLGKVVTPSRSLFGLKLEGNVLCVPIKTRPIFTARGITRTTDDNILNSPLKDINLPENPFVAHYVSEHWERFGDKVALIDSVSERRISYNDLRTLMTRVCSALVRLGFHKGDVVTIFLQNCVEYAVMYMAAMSLGMCVSCVNPLYTPDELQQVVTFSESKLLIVSNCTVDVARQALNNQPNQNGPLLLCINDSTGCHGYSNLLKDDGKAFPENIAYDSKNDVIALPYSSGTTGLPKGVMLTNYNLVVNLEQFGTPETLGMAHDDTYLCPIPMFHAFGQIVVMLLSLRKGSTIVIVPRFDPVGYLDMIQKYQPTYLHMVPPMIVLYAKHPLVPKYDFSSVKNVFFGAAPAAPAIVTELKERMKSDAQFIQGYGLTEASPGVTTGPTYKLKSETVGIPIHNTQLKIRDVTTDRLLGPNEEGEICCRGPQIMKGYLKNEAATRETIKDGWLHTGDIGRYDEEGYLTVTDRLKELIKYKGYQVAPAELEALLLTHPAVSDAAVIGVPDDLAGELPRGYVTLKVDKNATEEEIQHFVKSKVSPQKQLRGGVEFRPEIPKSPSGKILRRILKDELKQK